MKKLFPLLTFILFAGATFAQNVGINTPTPTSSLDVNGGLRLRPAVTTVSGASVILANNRTHHVLAGTLTGDFTISIAGATTEGQHLIITNGTLFKGFLAPINILSNTTVELIYSSAAWKLIGSNEPLNATGWSRTGNGGTSDGVNNLFGTTDNKPIRFIENNYPSGLMDAVKYNYFIGYGAGFSIGLGTHNAGFGSRTLINNISGDYNTAVGSGALSGNIRGSGATAVGSDALAKDTAADGAVAIGKSALYFNMAREGNTAVGSAALYSNCNPIFGPINSAQGLANTALGYTALYNNVSGSGSVAIGYRAAFGNISGDAIIAIGNSTLFNNKDRKGNIAIGDFALYNNGVGATGFNEGNNNVAVGNRALRSNTKGYSNTGIGFEVLWNNTIGSGNTAVGYGTLINSNGNDNTAIGSGALSSNFDGSGNVAIGANAGNVEAFSNKLYIENSGANKDNALIYGDFAADSLLINAKTINKFSLNVRGANALEMGYGVTNKQTDAGKICYGCFGDPAHWLGIVGGGLQANGGNDRVIKLWSEGGLRIRGNAMPDFGSTYTLGNTTTPWRSATTDSVRSNAYMLRNSTMHMVGAAGELVFRLGSSDIAKISSGGISPAADNDIYLGNPSRRFVSVYATIGVIQTSDANLKTNIQPTHYGLEEVLALNPVEYNWKDNPSGEKMVGLLAQEVQKIIPEAVVAPQDGSPLGMKYTELIPVLVKAIQEQQKKIEELERLVKKLQK